MKILFDYNVFCIQKIGGVSKYFLEIFSIISRYHDTKIVAPIHINDYLSDYKNKNIFCFFKLKKQYRFTRKITYFINSIIFKLSIKIFKPDIIHLTYFSKKLEFSKNCKIIITVHDLIHEIFEDDYKFGYSKKFKKNYILAADHIICISQNTKKDLIKLYDVHDKKISVVLHGYNQSKKFIKINDRFFEKPYLLYVGSRKNYKNFENFIIAYSYSPKLMRDFNIICFGGGVLSSLEKKFLKKLKINECKIKCIAGSDQELNYAYMKARAFICPSLYEGFGLTILEAMNMNCPIVSSNAGSLVEVGGNAVEYFNPRETEEIKNKIEKIVYSETNILKQKKEFPKILQKFSWETAAKETMSIYERLQNK